MNKHNRRQASKIINYGKQYKNNEKTYFNRYTKITQRNNSELSATPPPPPPPPPPRAPDRGNTATVRYIGRCDVYNNPEKKYTYAYGAGGGRVSECGRPCGVSDWGKSSAWPSIFVFARDRSDTGTRGCIAPIRIVNGIFSVFNYNARGGTAPEIKQVSFELNATAPLPCQNQNQFTIREINLNVKNTFNNAPRPNCATSFVFLKEWISFNVERCKLS